MSKVKATALGSQAFVIDDSKLPSASESLWIILPGLTTNPMPFKKTDTTLFTRKLDMASEGVKVASEGRRGGGDGHVTSNPSSSKNWAFVWAALAGLGQADAVATALGMLLSTADGEAPAASLCFSRSFLQPVGLICCLLPDSSTCLAPSFPWYHRCVNDTRVLDLLSWHKTGQGVRRRLVSPWCTPESPQLTCNSLSPVYARACLPIAETQVQTARMLGRKARRCYLMSWLL